MAAKGCPVPAPTSSRLLKKGTGSYSHDPEDIYLDLLNRIIPLPPDEAPNLKRCLWTAFFIDAWDIPRGSKKTAAYYARNFWYNSPQKPIIPQDDTSLYDVDYRYEILNSYVKACFRQYLENHKKRYLVLKNNKGEYKSRPLPIRFSRSYQKKVASSLSVLFKKNYRNSVLLTLTFDRKPITQEEAWEMVKPEFDRFMTDLQRKYGKFDYVATVEAQKAGWPHLHVLFLGVSWVAPWEDIVEYWKHGSIKINKTSEDKTIEKPISYIFKYITKTFKSTNEKNILTQAFVWFYGLRSFSCSRGLIPPINKITKGHVALWTLEGLIVFKGDIEPKEALSVLTDAFIKDLIKWKELDERVGWR